MRSANPPTGKVHTFECRGCGAELVFAPKDDRLSCEYCGRQEKIPKTLQEIRTSHTAIAFKHLLLPVWVGAYRYGGKTYQVTVNARTGEVIGDRPYSVWKIAGAVLLGLFLVTLFVLAGS